MARSWTDLLLKQRPAGRRQRRNSTSLLGELLEPRQLLALTIETIPAEQITLRSAVIGMDVVEVRRTYGHDLALASRPLCHRTTQGLRRRRTDGRQKRNPGELAASVRAPA